MDVLGVLLIYLHSPLDEHRVYIISAKPLAAVLQPIIGYSLYWRIKCTY